jgi:glycerol-3-phosphate acyltransferase PlsY
MTSAVAAMAAVLVAYFLGTFPSAILVARAGGVDISTFGSGNPGASNVTRALGWRKGAWVYALDALKGALAAGLGLAVDGRPLGFACGAAAIAGHMFPLFRHFRGGKGVATGSGVLVVLYPVAAPLAIAVWLIITKLTGKAALGSIIAVLLIPLLLYVDDTPAWEFVAAAGICGLIVVKHGGNIKRLIRREERSLSKM